MQHNSKPLISIITVNFNQPEVTLELLESLKESAYKNYEVIVVDNGSTVNPEETLKNRFPEVHYIRSGENLGFAGGNNLGIKKAKGDFLFFINNDTEITPSLFEELLNSFGENQAIGVVSPKIKYFYNPTLIQYAGYTPVSSFTGRNMAIGQREEDLGQHDQVCYTSYAHGAAMMVKREVIDQVGGIPEEYFLCYEELDWCAKISAAGYKILYQPKAIIFHKESVSMGSTSPLRLYYMTRNRILFMRRNFSKRDFMVFLLFFSVVSAPKASLLYLLKGQFEHFRAYCKAISWNMKN